MKQGLPAGIASLPIAPFLDSICSALTASPSHFLVLTAETAAGKSTAVPPALLTHFPGRILMLEPRRLAVLAITERIASLLGESPGQTAGYRMHLESCISPQTRLEILTEAILTRRLQNDPSLEGVNAVVIDEFHERSIHADLALAFLKEAMQLRTDLYVIVMSATIDTEQTAAFLGTENQPAPVFTVPGRQFPVTTVYAGNISPSQAVLQELRHPHVQQGRKPGSMLVFLPGIADIRRCASELQAAQTDADIRMLHSSISFQEQKKILIPPEPEAHRRVILSSAIAETSLTVPGVTVVIDSGLARINRMNVAAGMEQLVTENESVFSALQRAGRAGRTEPGTCICLWEKNEIRNTRTPPEILRTDLTQLVLECVQWGISDRTKLSWLDQPPESAWNAALELLAAMNCITPAASSSGVRITETGKAVLLLGIHPRLACTALAGSVSGALKYSSYKDASPEMQKRFCADLEQRIQKSGLHTVRIQNTAAALLAGFPDRLAHKTDRTGIYQFPSGRLASLPDSEKKNTSSFSEWIIAPEADAGERSGKIYSYEPISPADTEKWLSDHSRHEIQTEFADSHTLRKSENIYFGKILLSSKKLVPEPGDIAEAACSAVQTHGISWLPLSETVHDFLLRARFYYQCTASAADSRLVPLQHNPSDESLAHSVHEWLIPFMSNGTHISEQTVSDALQWYLDGETVDRNVPHRITLPNGRSYKLTYETRPDKEIQPVLEIIIQQIFGCFKTPQIMGRPVLLKLLSPARRPLQITDDLAGFWQNTWPEICKEMKGRYPRHNWDYRITEKE